MLFLVLDDPRIFSRPYLKRFVLDIFPVFVSYGEAFFFFCYIIYPGQQVNRQIVYVSLFLIVSSHVWNIRFYFLI